MPPKGVRFLGLPVRNLRNSPYVIYRLKAWQQDLLFFSARFRLAGTELARSSKSINRVMFKSIPTANSLPNIYHESSISRI